MASDELEDGKAKSNKWTTELVREKVWETKTHA
jgi:hypothetical protein